MSGKAMARTGLRMMPTFPSPPLNFRRAGLPQDHARRKEQRIVLRANRNPTCPPCHALSICQACNYLGACRS
jgi:hypothetical protein